MKQKTKSGVTPEAVDQVVKDMFAYEVCCRLPDTDERKSSGAEEPVPPARPDWMTKEKYEAMREDVRRSVEKLVWEPHPSKPGVWLLGEAKHKA